jgi:radical SAM superfamily enzyme YgiQ (UPF0313 family)
MKIIFCELVTNKRTPEEHMGTAYIAAYLEKMSIPSKCLIIRYDEDHIEYDAMLEQIDSEYDVYGLPLYDTTAEIVYEFCRKLKENNPNCKILVGGHLASTAYDLVFQDCSAIDFAILGFGEIPTYQIINALKNNTDISEIDSVIVRGAKNNNQKKPAMIDIKEIPWASRQYLERTIKAGSGSARICTSRGCVANCSFCSYNNYHNTSGGMRWQGRDMKDVYNEIIYLYETYGIRGFGINDGSFEDPESYGKDRIRELCELLLEYPVKFYFWYFLRAETFHEEDAELIQLMKKAGLAEAYIGIEAGNEQDLKLYKKRATTEDNRRCLKLFADNGVNVLLGFIMFNPFSTRETLKQNYDFLCSVNNWRAYAYVHKLTLYYDTTLYHKCKEAGLIGDRYSYLKPDNYDFVDKDAARIWEFVEKEFRTSVIMRHYDTDLYFLDIFYHNISSVYTDIKTKHHAKYTDLIDTMAYELQAFFKIVFVDYDLYKAKSELKILEEKFKNIMNGLYDLRYRILLNKSVKSYVSDLFKIQSDK